VRSHWREIDYWRWLWSRVPSEARWATLGVLLLGLLGGGWVVASKATDGGSDVAVGTKPIVIETTVQRMVTVREKGKVIRKLVPVVKRLKIVQKPNTVYQTQTQRNLVTRVVNVPGQSTTRTVSRLVPVVSTRQVTVNGKPKVVVTTRLQPTTKVETVPVTRTLVSTQSVTQTLPGVTNTNTVTRTQNQTQTRTQTQTQTQTSTVTRTDTVDHTVTDMSTVFDTITSTVTNTVDHTTTETETVTSTVHDLPPPPG